RSGVEPAGDQDLLLIASREMVDRLILRPGRNAKPCNQVSAGGTLAPEIEAKTAVIIAKARDGNIPRAGEVKEEAIVLAVLRQQTDPGRDRIGRRTQAQNATA